MIYPKASVFHIYSALEQLQCHVRDIDAINWTWNVWLTHNARKQ